MCDKLDIITTKCSIDGQPCGLRKAEVISRSSKFPYDEYRDNFYKCTKPGKDSKVKKPVSVPESF